MKSLSPWFQTANLLDGIRKTYSRIEAVRSGSRSIDRRSGAADDSKPKGKSSRGET